MKFNSDVYNKLYHPTPAETPTGGEAGGGVVDPQPKETENANGATDEPKQTTDVNVNINVTSETGTTAEAGEAGNTNESGEAGEGASGEAGEGSTE